eukprot:12429616-Karenia_brevis.AAC.1
MQSLAGKNNSPGLDGLPYDAWYKSKDKAVTIVHNLMRLVLDVGHFAGEEYMVRTMLVPKSLEHVLEARAVCPPEDVRPLGMKNTSLKTVTTSIHDPITPVIQRHTTPVQRGFGKGRHFTTNVL